MENECPPVPSRGKMMPIWRECDGVDGLLMPCQGRYVTNAGRCDGEYFWFFGRRFVLVLVLVAFMILGG